MISYKAHTYRPAPRMGSAAPQQLGSPSSMGAADWLLLLGGAVVGGAGINGLRNQFTGPGKANAIGVLVDVVLMGVGLTVFFQKGSQAIA